MYNNYKNKLIRKINQLRCYLINKNHENNFLNKDIGYLTIFHDFEGEYAGNGCKIPSLRCVTDILDIHAKYQIRATYNIVGKLINDLPDIIFRIKSDGHEIASHSYNHSIMTSLSRKEMLDDIMTTKRSFESIGVKFKGFRSPQGKWNFKQMHVLLNQGICWSAEEDKTKVPYVLIHGKDRVLVRTPITMDDWAYQRKRVHPEAMFDMLMATLDNIALKKNMEPLAFIRGCRDRTSDVLVFMNVS